jgi:hypothetical protein
MILQLGGWAGSLQLLAVKTSMLRNVKQGGELRGLYEHCNESSRSIKGREFLD